MHRMILKRAAGAVSSFQRASINSPEAGECVQVELRLSRDSFLFSGQLDCLHQRLKRVPLSAFAIASSPPHTDIYCIHFPSYGVLN